MSTDKTPDHTERYEWLGNANEWKSCTYEEAIKLSNAKYEVREIRPFAHCTCPSGDGSLRHPCPSHPATLATVKHGGCVQLPSTAGRDAAVEAMAACLHCAESSASLEDAREQAKLLLSEALPHLSAQPSPGGQGDDSDLLAELRDVEDYFEDVDPNPIHLATVRAAIEALAARQPVGEQ